MASLGFQDTALAFQLDSFQQDAPGTTVYTNVRVDWERTGAFTEAFCDVSSRVLDVSWTRGRNADSSGDAQGSATITVRNHDYWFTPDRNLHDNPSFEASTNGWLPLAIASLTAAGTSISRVADASVSGIYAGSAVLTATVNSGVYYPLVGRFRSGLTYACSVWLKSSAGNLNVRAGLASSGTPADIASSGANITGSWVQYSFTWTPSADRADAVFFVRTTTAATATVLIDAVQVNYGAAANTYLEAPTRGMLVPGRPVHIISTSSGVEYPEFYGLIQRITPDPEKRTATIVCYDILTAMGQKSLTLPAQNYTPQEVRIAALNYFAALRLNHVPQPVFADTTAWAGYGAFTSLTQVADFPTSQEPGPWTTAGEVVTSGFQGGIFDQFGCDLPVGGSARLTAWMRNVSGTTPVYVILSIGGQSRTPTYTLTSVWQRVTVLVPTTTLLAHDATVYFQSAGAASTFRVTGVQVTIGPEEWPLQPTEFDLNALPMNWLDGGSFESLQDYETSSGLDARGWVGARSNFVSNASFELDVAGWTLGPDAFVAAPAATDWSASVTPGSVYGDKSGYLNRATVANSGVFMPVTYTFRQGHSYTLKAKVRTFGGTRNDRVRIGIGSNGTPADFAEGWGSQTDVDIWADTHGLGSAHTWTPTADRSDVHIYLKTAAVFDKNAWDGVHIFGSTNSWEVWPLPVFTTENWGYGFEFLALSRVASGTHAAGAAHLECTTYAQDKSGIRYSRWQPASTAFPSIRTFYAAQPVTFAGWIKGVSGAGNYTVRIGSEGWSSDAASANVAATSSWSRFSVTWTPTADRSDVCVWVVNNGAISQTFGLDACAVYPGTGSYNYVPTFATMATEAGFVIPNTTTISGTVRSILEQVNSATLSRHWVKATMAFPWWSYNVASVLSETVLAPVETITGSASTITSFDLDESQIVNVQKVTPNSKYVSQTTDGTPLTANPDDTTYATDRGSIASYGPQPGNDLSLAMVPSDGASSLTLATQWVTRYGQPLARPTITRYNQFPSQLQREVGDLVIAITTRGLLGKYYFIVALTTHVIGPLWTTTYQLEESPY